MDYKTLTATIARKTGCDAAMAQRMIEGFCTIVREECADVNRVAIPGFGSFEGVKHDEEIINDLASGKRMLLPPSIEVKFVPGTMLKKTIREAR